MNKLMQQYRGSVAFAMNGPGPKPVFSPPDETGNDGGNKDGDNGNGNGGGTGGNDNDGGADAGGANKGGDKGGNGGGARQMGGLFAKRSGDGNKGDSGADDGTGGDATNGDGPKLPDKFLNKDKSTNVDALTKAYLDLEKSHGELKRSKGGGNGEVPKTAAEYFDGEIKLPDEASNFKGITSDDPGLKSWADVCHEEGISKDVATRLATKMMVKMNDHAPTPVDPDAEFAALGKNAQNIVDGLYTWVDGKATANEFSEEDVGLIDGMMQTAAGARLLVKFRNMSGEQPIPVNPGTGAKGMTMEQWRAEQAKAMKANDYARQAELDEILDRMNPDGA